MIEINDKAGKLPGRVQDRFKIKEGEIKSRQHLMLLPNTPASAEDAGVTGAPRFPEPLAYLLSPPLPRIKLSGNETQESR